MGEPTTISDSKEVFYREFPYVIPHVFRKIADEILVELNLLSNQNNFKPDLIFSLGLTSTFSELTKGYKPEKHIEQLFTALCKCNGLDPANIKNMSKEAITRITQISFQDLKASYDEKDFSNKGLEDLLKNRINPYNRLSLIGIFNLVKKLQEELPENEQSELQKYTVDIASKLGYQNDRVEKDITVYQANIDKLKQSLELIEFINKKSKK